MDLLVVGGYGVGLTFFTPRAPEAGETLSGARMSTEHGGKASNQAVGASRLGVRTGLLTAIGRDDRAAAALTMWQTEGVDVTAVQQLDGTTMVGCILVEKTGENRIVIADGVLNDLSAERITHCRNTFEEAAAVLVSCEMPTAAITAALRLGRDSGAHVILNPAPAPDLPDDAWDAVDLITPNRTEAGQLLGTADLDAATAAARLAERCRSAVVVTDGAAGCFVCESPGATPEHIDGISGIDVVDTTGAGDSFNSALACALLRGEDLAAAARFATRAASLTVQTPGVLPALPRAADVA